MWTIEIVYRSVFYSIKICFTIDYELNNKTKATIYLIRRVLKYCLNKLCCCKKKIRDRAKLLSSKFLLNQNWTSYFI